MRRDGFAERLEWIAGLVSALVVAGIVGFLLYEAAFTADSPPDLRVTAEPPVAEPGRAHLRYAVTNRGGRTAAAVVLSLSLRDGEALVDKRQLTLDYVPAHSRVTGGLYLPEGTGALDIELTVEGYVDP